MKFYPYLVWACIIIALVLMIFGAIHILWTDSFLGVKHAVNFFHIANSFLLLTICFKLIGKCSEEKK